MKKLSIILMISILLLSGCEIFTEQKEEKRIRHISVALDYANTEISVLRGTINDQKAVLSQLMHLAALEGTPFYATSFTQEGSHTYSVSYSDGYDGEKQSYYNSYSDGNLKNILVSKLEELAKDSRDGDINIFYYAGHGVNVSDDEGELLNLKGAMVLGDIYFPTIGDWRKESRNLSSMLSLAELRRLMDEFCGQSLIIMDSCYSGYIVEDDDGMSDYMDIEAAFTSLVGFSTPALRTLWQLTAARADELSYEEEEIEGISHGRFTKAMLEAMGYRFGYDYETPGSPLGASVSLASIWNKAVRTLGIRNQTPQSSQSAYDLVLFRL